MIDVKNYSKPQIEMLSDLNYFVWSIILELTDKDIEKYKGLMDAVPYTKYVEGLECIVGVGMSITIPTSLAFKCAGVKPSDIIFYMGDGTFDASEDIKHAKDIGEDIIEKHLVYIKTHISKGNHKFYKDEIPEDMRMPDNELVDYIRRSYLDEDKFNDNNCEFWEDIIKYIDNEIKYTLKDLKNLRKVVDSIQQNT